jgi:hypothetical protein
MPRGVPNKVKGKGIAAPPAAPAPEFHLFPKLPIEIRQEILSYLIPEARIVTIWSAKGGGATGREQKERKQIEKKQGGPSTVPTVLLHVNKELREFAMRWYTLSFGLQ